MTPKGTTLTKPTAGPTGGDNALVSTMCNEPWMLAHEPLAVVRRAIVLAKVRLERALFCSNDVLVLSWTITLAVMRDIWSRCVDRLLRQTRREQVLLRQARRELNMLGRERRLLAAIG